MAGTATISIEIELGWGAARYGTIEKISPGRRAETAHLEALLEHCEEHDVPVSFDVVGHLLLERCDGHVGSPHGDGWWDCDPRSSLDEDPLFYAPDLVERIRRSPVDHEICTHTFSHVECDAVTDDVLEWEFDAVREVHRQEGYPEPRSIVSPRHRPIPTRVLRDHGIVTQRITGDDDTTTLSKPALFFNLLRDTLPVRSPETVDGVTNTYSKHYPTLTTPILPQGQYDPHPVFQRVPTRWRRRWHRRLLERPLERAIQRESYTHYWCHLYDLSNGAQFPQIASFLERLGTDREVTVRTMAELGGGPAETDQS